MNCRIVGAICNIILLRPKQFWSVFNEEKHIILKKVKK